MSLPQHPRPAVFFGLRALLAENGAFSSDAAALRFMPGLCEALGLLASGGFALVIATRQSGIARGLYTRSQFAVLQASLQRRLMDEAGVVLEDFVLCPHAPGADGAPACLCRKPAPGLLIRAARVHGFDLAASWMIGSTLDDIEAGHRAGCRSLLLEGGSAAPGARSSPLRTPDAHGASWLDAASIVLQGSRTDALPAMPIEVPSRLSASRWAPASLA